jgi:hypothetical protein
MVGAGGRAYLFHALNFHVFIIPACILLFKLI